MSELCRLRDVHMGYGREEVLCGVELAISRGAIWGLVGDNGSGKSTLLKVMAGILRPARGWLEAPGDKPRIGYMPENCQWYPHMTGAQVLRYFARYSGAGIDEQEAILKRVGLWAARDKKIGAYSKGMRQKLGLAQAIAGDPELLILDEPTNGLDPRGIIDFYAILQERVAAGATVLLSSHLLAELDGRISHVAFLCGGRIVDSGACAALLRAAGLPCRVVIEAEDTAALDRAVGAGQWSFRRRGRAVEIELPTAAVRSLLRLVGGGAFEVDSVQIRPPNLEDLYLRGFAAPFSDNGQSDAVPVGKGGSACE